MDIMGFFQKLNIIDLFNSFLPSGTGEIITLIAWMASFLAVAVLVSIFTLSKERLHIDVVARITMKGKGIIMYPDGSTKEVLIKRKQAVLIEKLNEENNLEWIIRPEGWDRQSNGVSITLFHYDLPHNVGINELAKFYKGYEQDLYGQNEKGELVKIGTRPYRPLILSAREIDSNIVKLANAEVAAQIDPHKKLINAAIAISLIMATTAAIIVLFIFVVPNAPDQAAPAVKAVAETTTTIMQTSGIAGVSGG